jgi:hypothetical protein
MIHEKQRQSHELDNNAQGKRSSLFFELTNNVANEQRNAVQSPFPNVVLMSMCATLYGSQFAEGLFK